LLTFELDFVAVLSVLESVVGEAEQLRRGCSFRFFVVHEELLVLSRNANSFAGMPQTYIQIIIIRVFSYVVKNLPVYMNH